MIRLTLVQFRLQAIIVAGILVLAAILFAISGQHLYHLYNTTVAACPAGSDCSAAKDAFLNNHVILRQLLGLLLLLAPALLGIFWGAPLVAREYESGTFRLAWTQSISRGRWLLTRVALLGLASVIVAAALSLLFTWWSGPFVRITADRFNPGNFDERGVVAIGYALFAFALGLTFGVVIRRTLPAMALTLASFLAVRLAFTFLLRPHLMAPHQASMPLQSGEGLGFSPSASGITFSLGTPNIDNAWAISSKVVDSAGHTASNSALHAFMVNACPAIVSAVGSGQSTQGVNHAPADPTVFHDCILKLAQNYHLVVSYQPASRYWTFQWTEMGIYAGLSLLLAGFCYWWVRRRIA